MMKPPPRAVFVAGLAPPLILWYDYTRVSRTYFSNLTINNNEKENKVRILVFDDIVVAKRLVSGLMLGVLSVFLYEFDWHFGEFSLGVIGLLVPVYGLICWVWTVWTTPPRSPYGLQFALTSGILVVWIVYSIIVV